MATEKPTEVFLLHSTEDVLSIVLFRRARIALLSRSHHQWGSAQPPRLSFGGPEKQALVSENSDDPNHPLGMRSVNSRQAVLWLHNLSEDFYGWPKSLNIGR